MCVIQSSVIECTLVQVEYMRRDGENKGVGGVIVNISSIAGI